MSQRKIRFISSAIVFVLFISIQLYQKYNPSSTKVLSATAPAPSGIITNTYLVSKVVDGDTLDVMVSGKATKIRVLGINTPETVDPRKPVQCFGKAASDHAKSLLTGQSVRLENDLTQGDKDKYGRLLRYIFLSNGQDYGKQMILEGYAYEYTYDTPYKYQKEYRLAQKNAESKSVGLWSPTSCAGKL